MGWKRAVKFSSHSDAPLQTLLGKVVAAPNVPSLGAGNAAGTGPNGNSKTGQRRGLLRFPNDPVLLVRFQGGENSSRRLSVSALHPGAQVSVVFILSVFL